MKHHIALKFIALALSALMLLVVIGSAAGIVVLAAADLYERSVDDLIAQQQESTLQHLSVSLVHRYASLQLGGNPEEYYYSLWGSDWMFEEVPFGTYFYTILDENGTVVVSTAEDLPDSATRYTQVVTDLSYRRLVEILPEGETIEATSSVDDAVHRDTYYDSTLGRYVTVWFAYADLPPYTVELYLLPEALESELEPVYDMLQAVYGYRMELFWILSGSLLLLAALVVYLCTAAGRRPQSGEVRAGALNRIPLDLYTLTGMFLGILLLGFGPEVASYLLHHSLPLLVPFVLVAGYCCCLLLVCCGFAWVAQIKTPGGFWWRNTLCARFIRLCFRFFAWLRETCFPALGRGAKSAWKAGCRGILSAYRFTETGLTKLLRWLGKVFRALCSLVPRLALSAFRFVDKALTWLGKSLGKLFRKLFSQLHRFLSLLPLTWQWLLVGFLMFLMMALVFAANGEEVLVVLCLGFCVSIILYGAHCFGLLMESTRKMGQGDLETKVDDKLLIGSFKEFAGDLNALADVAVVAAQKQLKSERMKTELITNVSHDIKTPLTSIINYVDLLQKPHTQEEAEAYLEVLSRQSLQLKKLIDDLMELSKASTGNMSVNPTELDAAEAINQALGEFSEKLEKAGLIPVFHQPETPVNLLADGRLCWRVLSNLLSNACKYALPGTRLYIDLMKLEGSAIISIKNISREQLNVSPEELLERFVRGDISRNTEGSGLGLNIAKSLMELQKGQLQLMVDGDLFKVTLIFPAA